MGIVSRLLARDSQRNLSLTDPGAWRSAFSLAVSTAGRDVTPMSALQSVAVYACVRVLAESIATLPLIIYRRLDPRGKERATDHPLYPVLHDRPNPEMTSVELRECIVGHLALRGNAYLEIVRDRDMRVVELWPLRPDCMRVERGSEGTLEYYYTRRGVEIELDPSIICHIRGISGDGIHGWSPIALARDAIGLTLATEEYGARWFSGGARPGGVLQAQGKLSQEAADRGRAQHGAGGAGQEGTARELQETVHPDLSGLGLEIVRRLV